VRGKRDRKLAKAERARTALEEWLRRDSVTALLAAS